MPFQVIPRELAFYGLFERAADGVAEAARELLSLVDDLPDGHARAERIHDLEHAGDDLTHEIMAKLNITFVTPIDRHDIHRLASHLDDVIDHIEAVSDLLILHRIEEPLPRFRQQVEVLVKATRRVRKAVGKLRYLSKTPKAVADIKRQEREGDWVYRRAVATLFSGDYDPLEVIKWRDLLKEVEAAVDRCEDIANTIESVAAKFA